MTENRYRKLHKRDIDKTDRKETNTKMERSGEVGDGQIVYVIS